jgi:predicted AAA+ superfamily ATPase
MNSIPRTLLPSLFEHLETRQVTVITGFRRTGKTTLVKMLLDKVPSPNKLYLDLERLDNRLLFREKNYDNVVLALKQRGLDTKAKMYLALDEIQLEPNLPGIIKYLYDMDSIDIKFIVTGSSSYYLKNLFSESLSGRKKVFELRPLYFGEFLSFNGISYSETESPFGAVFSESEYHRLHSFYEDFVNYGGFPEVALADRSSMKEDLLSDILDSYINIDIKALSDFKNRRNVSDLVALLAPRIGNKIETSNLSRASGLARETVGNYLQFFEHTYLISAIGVHTHSPDREIVKARKLYFIDNGLAGRLAKMSGGALFENALRHQLSRYGEIKYFSLKNGREIDFVLNGELALEAKETPDKSDLRDVESLAERAGLKRAVLVGRNTTAQFHDFIWGGSIF